MRREARTFVHRDLCGDRRAGRLYRQGARWNTIVVDSFDLKNIKEERK